MTPKGYIIALSVLGYSLGGCASTPPPEPVKPVTVKVVGSDFCPIMKAIRPPDGLMTWVPTDSVETIDGNRAVNAAVTKRCVSKQPPTPK